MRAQVMDTFSQTHSLLEACSTGDNTAVANLLQNKINTNCSNEVSDVYMHVTVLNGSGKNNISAWGNSIDSRFFTWPQRDSGDASINIH